MEEIDLELKELNYFFGTEQYHKGFLGVNLTDGVFYVQENGYAWFISDVISVIKTKLKNEEFLSIKLNLNGNKAEMSITDGNENVLYTQKYEWTDAKKELHFYFADNVLMLDSEY